MSIDAVKTIQKAIGFLNSICEELDMIVPLISSSRLDFTQQDSCIYCTNFDEENELCRLANQRPPARVVVQGCPKFDLEIPF